MRLSLICSSFLLIAFLACGSFGAQEPPVVATADPRTPAEEQKCFHLPPGFQIELVASEPDIIKPINMNFDDRGRLWVTQSVEYPFPAAGEKKPRDTIKIFENFQSHGRASNIITFADGLNIPIGVLPIHHGAIAYSVPNIYRFLDSNGDDRADRRDLLYGSIGSIAFRDTHGMTSAFTWGFDGWIYACHGFNNASELKGADGAVVRMESGNTFRMQPDGSHVEQFTHGQVNPFGLCFDPLGNLYSADCHTRPVMLLLRGAYYDSFGKPHDGLGYAPETCPNYERSTAVAGIAYYAADQYPAAYQDTIFFGDVVTNEINQYHLERHGSTYKGVLQPRFLTCDDPWFRPVDIKLGLDGALYVADFYNRIIGHYEVPLTHPGRDHQRGRIWRIVYRGSDPSARPAQAEFDLDRAGTEELIADLGHANLVVRLKAANQLADRGDLGVVNAVRAAVDAGSNPYQRLQGLWVLDRLHALDDARLAAAAHDSEVAVRVHAMHILSERPQLSRRARRLVLAGLQDPDGFVKRAAVDALGRHPSADNLRPLLDLRHTTRPDDTQLVHTVRMALRDHLLLSSTWKILAKMEPISKMDATAIADVALGAPTPEAARFLLTQLRKQPNAARAHLKEVHHIARHGDAETIRALLGFARDQHSKDLRGQAALFKEIHQGTQERGQAPSAAARQWGETLVAALLASGNGQDVVTGAELAGSLQLKSSEKVLAGLAGKQGSAASQRRAALDALVAIDLKGHEPLLVQLLADAAEQMPLRERAVELLANLNQPETHALLLKALEVAPAPLQRTIADRMTNTPEGAAKLVGAVTAGKASARLLQDPWIQMRLVRYPKLKDQMIALTKGLPSADERLLKLQSDRRRSFQRAQSDPGMGARIFEKNCAICHQVAGKGAKVGPQLDGIGTRGLDRLLEDIIDPNRNVDQAFRSTTLALKNGQVVTGLVLREEGQVVVLADAQGKEVRIPKADIDERSVTQMSPMPANFAEQIPEVDFHHLLAYLLSLRSPSAAK